METFWNILANTLIFTGGLLVCVPHVPFLILHKAIIAFHKIKHVCVARHSGGSRAHLRSQ